MDSTENRNEPAPRVANLRVMQEEFEKLFFGKNNNFYNLDDLYQASMHCFQRAVDTTRSDMLKDFFSKCQVQVRNHPFISLILAVLAIMCSIPILAFISFVVVTVTFTFFGFVFVEGTLLTIAIMVLMGVILVFAFISVCFGVFVAVTWLVLNRMWQMMEKARPKPTTRHVAFEPSHPQVIEEEQHADFRESNDSSPFENVPLPETSDKKES